MGESDRSVNFFNLDAQHVKASVIPVYWLQHFEFSTLKNGFKSNLSTQAQYLYVQYEEVDMSSVSLM
jgi:hypothetical protein